MTNNEKAEAIIRIVCNDFNLSRWDVVGKRRLREYVMARHFAMYYIRKFTRLTLDQTGQMFNRDHATVLNAENNAQDLIQWNGCKAIDERLTKAISKALFSEQLAALNRTKRNRLHVRTIYKRSRLFKIVIN